MQNRARKACTYIGSEYPTADCSALGLLEPLVKTLDAANKFDIFHGLFLPSAKACLHIAAGRPVIASIRGADAAAWLRVPERAAVIREVIAQSTWITTVASDLLAPLVDTANRIYRTSAIANSIDESKYPDKWTLEKAERGAVGTVANFRKKKNIPLLLSGFAGIPKNHRSKLVLCGGFQYDPELKRQLLLHAGKLGLEQSIDFTGLVRPREVQSVVKKMHAFAITSNDEGMPNALLEAAAIGVPLVCSDVGGMHDIIEDGVNGLLVPAGDESKLSHALSRILSDDNLAKRLSQGALDLAKQLTPERECREWTALYERILADHIPEIRNAALARHN